MDEGQYSLCSRMLAKLDREGILRHVIIVGSWCLLGYEEFFAGIEYHPLVRTTDIDILVPLPTRFRKRVNLESLLKDLDFVISLRGSHGNISFLHRELLLEFLVPEQGRGSDKPYPLPDLGANAQRLRFLSFLAADTIWGTLGDVRVRLPHPARFGLHKLLVSTRRKKAAKRDNDRRQGIYVLEKLVESGRKRDVRVAYEAMHEKWRRAVRRALEEDPLGHVILQETGLE